jgi:hypothetical protein
MDESNVTRTAIRIISACCVIASLVLWWAGAGRLKTIFHRFEAAYAERPLASTYGGAYATTDHYLSELQVAHPSEAVLRAMGEVPSDDAMIFITLDSDERAELIYRSIAYLGWPRQIGETRCGANGAALLFHPPARKPIKWLIFYRLAPPVDLMQPAQRIGPHLTLVPVTELREWKWYCSR